MGRVSLIILLAFAGQAYAQETASVDNSMDDEKLLNELINNADEKTVDMFASRLIDKMTERASEVEPDLFQDFDETTLSKGGGGAAPKGKAPPRAPPPAPAPSGGGPQWLQNLLDSGGGVTPTSGQIPSRGQRALEDAPPRKGGIKVRNPFAKALPTQEISISPVPIRPGGFGAKPNMMRAPFESELNAEDDESPSMATFFAVMVLSFCTGSGITLALHYLSRRGARSAGDKPLMS